MIDNKKVMDAMLSFAGQNTVAEIKNLGMYKSADFEGAYDTMILMAREAVRQNVFKPEDLSPNERIVLLCMMEEIHIPIKEIAANCRSMTGNFFPQSRVRSCINRLRAKNLAAYGHLMDDEGLLRGWGYYLTYEGRKLQREIGDSALVEVA